MRIGCAAMVLALPCAGSLFIEVATAAAPLFQSRGPASHPDILMAAAQSCKQVDSCEEAVQIWCDGYRRADGDGDGIPCENVCHSKEQVDLLRAQIGC